MKLYTGREYLFISIANAFGLDKLLFEERIEWVESNIDNLENMTTEADEPLLFKKGVHTLREAEQGTSTGFMCALDASNSGAQIMSALTGCKAGATATGLVEPNRRADAYGDLTQEMNKILGSEQVQDKREDLKQAFMTWLYGSKAEPKKLFGNTPAYPAFFEAMNIICPGAVACREALINAWQPYADEHTLLLPDGFNAVIRTQQKVSYELKLKDIPDAKYVLNYSKFEGTEKSVSLCANAIHAIDALVVREMNRRCNYNTDIVKLVHTALVDYCEGKQATCFKEFVSLRQLENLKDLKEDMNTLCRLRDLCEQVLQWETSPLLVIHDSFMSHPNHMNKVRYWYKEILAELADSNLLQDILRQLYQDDSIVVEKDIPNLSDYIRNSNYSLT